MDQSQNNSIFWIETEKIKPNPYQPRREFDEGRLRDLSESIRQYGILQPLVVTRTEIETQGGMLVEYELIAGERRLRASRLAGLFQVPVIIRADEGGKIKLELAIIENLQREDLNPVDKARAFKRLVDEFNLKHHEVATKVGMSREVISNTLRILALPEEILQGLGQKKITDGHTRPLLMLTDRPAEQFKLYEEIVMRKMTVREAESISRRIASERVRQKSTIPDSETRKIEDQLSDDFGTRVQIEKFGDKGKIVINFFSNEELQALLQRLENQKEDQSKSNETDPAEVLPVEVVEPVVPAVSSDEDEEIVDRFTI